MEQVKQKLKTKLQGKVDADVIDQVPVIVADGSDREALLELISKMRVVLSVAGPYVLYSALLVELCAQHGVHYCNLTGAKLNVDKFEAAAIQSGARIVYACGFEAVPSDIMTFLLVDAVRKHRQTKVSRVNYFWKEAAGQASGGTCISLLLCRRSCPYRFQGGIPHGEVLCWDGQSAQNRASL